MEVISNPATEKINPKNIPLINRNNKSNSATNLSEKAL
jgi:hypothetical protein